MQNPYRYNLINDYQQSDSSYISHSPYWAIAIFGMVVPVTYARTALDQQISPQDAVKLRSNHPLIITDSCVSLSVECSKRNHTKSLTANIKNTANLLNSQNAVPGDWVMAWCWSNDVDRNRTLKNLKERKAANDINSGLKFVGRLHDVRKNISVSQDGIRESTYSIQAIGFDELDTNLYYDFNLGSEASAGKKGVSDWALFMSEVGLDFFKVLEDNSIPAGSIHNNSGPLIEGLIDVIIGSAKRRGNDDLAIVESQNQAPHVSGGRRLFRTINETYIIPSEVATTLGVVPIKGDLSGGSKTTNKYADILETLIGVQQYKPPTTVSDDKRLAPECFYPQILTTTTNRHRTTIPLKGSHLPLEPSFVNKPLYTLLQTYANTAINEMYTALKVNWKGNIVPTLVARQIPFSTEAAVENQAFPLTRYLSLPRWLVSPTMVHSVSVGRSNATRFNLVHVYGTDSIMENPLDTTAQMTVNPPIFDFADIARNGLRPLMQTVNCSVEDIAEQLANSSETKEEKEKNSGTWMKAIADWSMGSHLTLNGQIVMTGVQSPIAEGDNIEFEGVVYHIESLSHQCSISYDGVKKFATTVNISNGMPSDQKNVHAYPRYPGFQSLPLQVNEFTTTKETTDYFMITKREYSSDVDAEDYHEEKFIEPRKIITETKHRETTQSLAPDDEILTSQDPGDSIEK